MGTFSEDENEEDTKSIKTSDDEGDQEELGMDEMDEEYEPQLNNNTIQIENENDSSENEVENNKKAKTKKSNVSTYTKDENIEYIDTNINNNGVYYKLPQFDNTNYGCRSLNNMTNYCLHFFTQLLTYNMIETICNNTNIYANITNRKGWKPLTNNEFELFMSIVLYMGICKLPRRSDYWSNEFFQSFVYNKMSFDRFTSILLCMHYVDVTNITPNERLNKNKVDPFWLIADFEELLSKHCFEHWTSNQFLSLDESCIPFTGRHLAKQYNPSKPNKWHLRQYSLNDPTTGYLLCFRFYRGKCENYPNGITASQFPVYYLTQKNRFYNNGYIVVTDRYYTSIPMMNMLVERGIGFLGTVLSNRLPIDKKLLYSNKNKNINRGDSSVYTNEDNSHRVITWKDNKVVNILTTLETGWHYTKKSGATGHKLDIKCPTAISLYSAKMRGTDMFDQHMSYYWPYIRSVKWTVRVFIHLFYIAVINSHILYKNYFSLIRGNSNFELIDYIKNLMNELGNQSINVPMLQNSNNRRRRVTLDQEKNRLTGVHTPYDICFILNNNNERIAVDKRVECAYCQNGKVSVICKTCNKGLHVGSAGKQDCFYLFHTKNKLTEINNTNEENDYENEDST